MRRVLHLLTALALFSSPVRALDTDILLVLDGGTMAKQEQLEGFYGPLCLAAQRTYQVWNVSQAGTVPASALTGTGTLVWLTGDNDKPVGIAEPSEALRAYAAQGGHVVLAGLHAGSVAREFLKSDLGLEFKRHNRMIDELLGRFPDVIAQGNKLKLATAGCETAAYAKRPEVQAETVFSVADRGVMHLAAARVERLGASASRTVWFGFDLPSVSESSRAGELFTRAIRWTVPAPAAHRQAQSFQLLWESR